jgi:hypothetical protein
MAEQDHDLQETRSVTFIPFVKAARRDNSPLT